MKYSWCYEFSKVGTFFWLIRYGECLIFWNKPKFCWHPKDVCKHILCIFQFSDKIWGNPPKCFSFSADCFFPNKDAIKEMQKRVLSHIWHIVTLFLFANALGAYFAKLIISNKARETRFWKIITSFISSLPLQRNSNFSAGSFFLIHPVEPDNCHFW